jgi:Kef-type K+ transport system membrane component KefB
MFLPLAVSEIGPVLLGLCVVLVVAKLGGEAAARLRQPTVVGEILAGVFVGNLGLLGLGEVDLLGSDVFDVFAEIGILLLLFEIGVESTVPQMMKTGLTAVLVAVIGVAAPLALGAGVSWLFFPAAPGYTHLFVGAILCATSVGITARVLQELGCLRSAESRLILAAAVIDDVLGLILLATVAGLVVAADQGASISAWEVTWTTLKAVLFLAVSIPLGLWFAPPLFRWAARFRTRGLLLASGLAFCFLFAYLCTLVGLAPIIGAFAAGLILEERHLEDLSARERKTLVQQIEPLTSFLLPVFFVLIGTRVDVRAFASASVLGFAAALSVAAVVGKLACAAAVRRPVDAWTVGLGMVPRGEVGFIFASIGTTLYLDGEAIVTPSVFAAAVLVVIASTLAAPPLLSARLRRASCTVGARVPSRVRGRPSAS